MSSLNGQFISNVTKNIYSSDPSFFGSVFNYNKKSGQVTFKEVLTNKAHVENTAVNSNDTSVASYNSNSSAIQSGSGSIPAYNSSNNGGASNGNGVNVSGSHSNNRVHGGSSTNKVHSNSGSTTAQELEKIFQEAAKKYNVDVRLLKAMAKVESGFNTKAVSPAGAKGIMQLMPCNIKDAGVTDPFDPRQNIMAGAKEISYCLKKYKGNLDLALAGYNAGVGNVAKYGGIPPFKETQNYIKKVKKYMNTDINIADYVKEPVNKKELAKVNERLDKITYDNRSADVKVRY